VFSARLERLRQFDRLAELVAATLLAGDIVLIAVWTVRALKMLEAAEVDRAPIIIGVVIALRFSSSYALSFTSPSGLLAASYHVKCLPV
jgi:hypothetical protein